MPIAVVQITLNGLPVNGVTDDPEISIVRLSDDVEVVSDTAMLDTGARGLYKFNYSAGAPGERFAYAVDADPNATGQVDVRTLAGVMDNEIRDLWNDHGLNPASDKTIAEVTEGASYDEAVTDADGPNIAKDVDKAGATTTLDRSP